MPKNSSKRVPLVNHLPDANPLTQPQTVQVHPAQVQNHAGGYSFEVDQWTRLHRFLIMGSDKTYYQSEAELTVENAAAVAECLKEDARRTIEYIQLVSASGMAAKNEPAILALAMACSPRYVSDLTTRDYAFSVMPKVARTGTMFFQFVNALKALRGLGRAARSGIARWYLDNDDPLDVAFQVAKYPSRDGWTHADVLRLIHAEFKNPIMQVIARRVLDIPVDKERVSPNGTSYPAPDSELPDIFVFRDQLHNLQKQGDIEAGAKLIAQHGLPREVVPTEWLNDKSIWAALLQNMPYHAMLRNLGKMARVGLIAKYEKDAAVSLICERLGNAAAITRARLHPVDIYTAMHVYSQGHGERSSAIWSVNTHIVDALNDAFYIAFGNLVSTGKRIHVGIDVSGSMGQTIAGSLSLTAARGAGLMAAVLAAKEEKVSFMLFDTLAYPISISPKRRLDDIWRDVCKHSGGTNLAIPLSYAIKTDMQGIDAFVILTDDETWAGTGHPHDWLKKYRQKFNPNAKMIVISMVANGLTIGDPNDKGVLNLCGLDTNTFKLLDLFLQDDL